MKEQTVPYLCGGVFFVLLTEAKGKSASRRKLKCGKKDRVSNRNMLEALIQMLMPSFKQPTVGRTFEGDTSDYRSCKVSYGANLPFDDGVEINRFDDRVKNRYLSVLDDMERFVEEYLKTESDERMQWLTQALLTLIDKDTLIKPNEQFYLSDTPITKSELLALNHYCLSALLIGIWHYIIMHRPDNMRGRSTFEAWHCRSNGTNGRWRFISNIGKNYPKPITYQFFGENKGESWTEDRSGVEDMGELIDGAYEGELPKVEVYEAPFTDPITQKQVVAEFHVEAKDNGVAIGQVFGGLVIGKRGNKDE